MLRLGPRSFVARASRVAAAFLAGINSSAVDGAILSEGGRGAAVSSSSPMARSRPRARFRRRRAGRGESSPWSDVESKKFRGDVVELESEKREEWVEQATSGASPPSLTRYSYSPAKNKINQNYLAAHHTGAEVDQKPQDRNAEARATLIEKRLQLLHSTGTRMKTSSDHLLAPTTTSQLLAPLPRAVEVALLLPKQLTKSRLEYDGRLEGCLKAAYATHLAATMRSEVVVTPEQVVVTDLKVVLEEKDESTAGAGAKEDVLVDERTSNTKQVLVAVSAYINIPQASFAAAQAAWPSKSKPAPATFATPLQQEFLKTGGSLTSTTHSYDYSNRPLISSAKVIGVFPAPSVTKAVLLPLEAMSGEDLASAVLTEEQFAGVVKEFFARMISHGSDELEQAVTADMVEIEDIQAVAAGPPAAAPGGGGAGATTATAPGGSPAAIIPTATATPTPAPAAAPTTLLQRLMNKTRRRTSVAGAASRTKRSASSVLFRTRRRSSRSTARSRAASISTSASIEAGAARGAGRSKRTRSRTAAGARTRRRTGARTSSAAPFAFSVLVVASVPVPDPALVARAEQAWDIHAAPESGFLTSLFSELLEEKARQFPQSNLSGLQLQMGASATPAAVPAAVMARNPEVALDLGDYIGDSDATRCPPKWVGALLGALRRWRNYRDQALVARAVQVLTMVKGARRYARLLNNPTASAGAGVPQMLAGGGRAPSVYNYPPSSPGTFYSPGVHSAPGLARPPAVYPYPVDVPGPAYSMAELGRRTDHGVVWRKAKQGPLSVPVKKPRYRNGLAHSREMKSSAAAAGTVRGRSPP
mmetsp:Transcript_5935/g.14744  ORF Transcript_5935/g.14744 Transcript_5935/m.14744 type:complete len:817 (+) Transcript_5935:172-2622(+)